VRLLKRPARTVYSAAVRLRTSPWPPHSRLFAVGDSGGWSVDEDAEHLAAAAGRLGFQVGPTRWARFATSQSVFLTSHFEALTPRWLESPHRLATAYLHGRPGTPGVSQFDEVFTTLRTHRERFSRVQVTHAEMHELVLEAGVPSDRVHRIPIGIDLASFPLGDEASKEEARAWLDVPREAFVVGSFQKDGVGWGEGLEPKLVKGPDVLLATLAIVADRIPELFVLLTGPARGYVKRGLAERGIPFRHIELSGRRELARAYHALDVYVVASRQEGGPKAVLEAMATGAALVSTRVGQAAELVSHGQSGWLAEVEDAEELASLVQQVYDGGFDAIRRCAARAVAERHDLMRLDARWRGLLEGFVERERRDSAS
jgi:glycosyltransferase involved in cell wall biosynthesis